MRRANPYRAFLLGAVPLLALLALLIRSSALAGLALAFAVLVFRSWRAAHARVRGIGVAREVYPSAFEDDVVPVDLVVENRSGRSALLLEVIDAFGPSLADRQALLEPGPFPSPRRRRLRYSATCSRGWGSYALGPVRVAAADSLGLFRAERAVGGLDGFAVFPRVYDVQSLRPAGARGSLSPQEATTGRPGQGALYLGVREFRPGDALRRVHWPATARRGSPVVKEFERDLVPYSTLFVDLHRRNRAGTGRKSTFEYLVRAAASLAWSAERRGELSQLFAEGSQAIFVPPGRGEVHLTQLLFELIRGRQDGATDLLELVARHRDALPPGSTTYVVSGTAALVEGALAEALAGLTARGVRPLFLLIDRDSFVPIDRWPLPREQARRRNAELAAFLAARGAESAVLEAEQDLAEELARPDLFAATA
ncbi:MAG TPA: DUF58 domain-containing protein [Vicinamibacteria bacterium]|nr:DUF58 domain-containing protein [Vicinamibacteria bacterium]